ncbi:MAG: hypothetical protein KQI35_01215 [Bacteroidetes bacterium]|nr:hypothetical protein [Bacteroidota bacterium]
MENNYFESFGLNNGDTIRIVKANGDVFIGYYREQYDFVNGTFLFYNFSTGMDEVIDISGLQFLVRE